MRAVAAILVMLFHLTHFFAEDFDLLAFENLFSHGESGVDIFFVISGFVIYHSTKARQSPRRLEFVASRLIRIFPIYWLVMLALVLAEGLGLTRNPERLDPATIAVSALLLPSR